MPLLAEALGAPCGAFRLPVIDTLVPSPLSHPQNPRHGRFTGGASGEGMADLLGSLGARPMVDAAQAAAAFARLTGGGVCNRAGARVGEDFLADPDCRMALAYVTAWIGVTEHGDSVLPPWVLRRRLLQHTRANEADGRGPDAGVAAMIRRTAEDSGEDYRGRLRVPRWEVPVAEVWWRE